MILATVLLLKLELNTCLLLVSVGGIDSYALMPYFTFDLMGKLLDLIDKAPWLTTHFFDEVLSCMWYWFLLWPRDFFASLYVALKIWLLPISITASADSIANRRRTSFTWTASNIAPAIDTALGSSLVSAPIIIPGSVTLLAQL